MNKLRQSFRRKKDVYVPESSRPHQWQTDEEAVRGGKCSFAVKYLGHVEVEESRGMHICEEAVKKLKTVGYESTDFLHLSHLECRDDISCSSAEQSPQSMSVFLHSQHISLFVHSTPSDLFKACLSPPAVLFLFR
ncbi:hypothetical protein H4Q32_011488 [Labeo rohita]|uniref:PID domain-containing protein n=1 Tax=Labeo rohita TaxID=84645 RepID=A0ABQ8LVT5_LABRO|nr:hypothetical protein H4Q32_011488 [Labeo rohita]